jgi:hypothetical protein
MALSPAVQEHLNETVAFFGKAVTTMFAEEACEHRSNMRGVKIEILGALEKTVESASTKANAALEVDNARREAEIQNLHFAQAQHEKAARLLSDAEAEYRAAIDEVRQATSAAYSAKETYSKASLRLIESELATANDLEALRSEAAASTRELADTKAQYEFALKLLKASTKDAQVASKRCLLDSKKRHSAAIDTLYAAAFEAIAYAKQEIEKTKKEHDAVAEVIDEQAGTISSYELRIEAYKKHFGSVCEAVAAAKAAMSPEDDMDSDTDSTSAASIIHGMSPQLGYPVTKTAEYKALTPEPSQDAEVPKASSPAACKRQKKAQRPKKLSAVVIVDS